MSQTPVPPPSPFWKMFTFCTFAVQCSAVQCSALQCGAVQCSAVGQDVKWCLFPAHDVMVCAEQVWLALQRAHPPALLPTVAQHKGQGGQSTNKYSV